MFYIFFNKQMSAFLLYLSEGNARDLSLVPRLLGTVLVMRPLLFSRDRTLCSGSYPLSHFQ